jgi:uncharacterized damage-inducible protein DinB
MPTTSITHLIDRWTNVRTRLLTTVDKFSEAELDYRPFPTSWTVRRLMLHIAHEEQGEFNHGLTQILSQFPPEYDPLNYPDRAALKALLAQVHEPNLAYLATLTDADLERIVHTPWGDNLRLVDMVDHLVEHEIHHRAELSLILGLLGKRGLDA